ncbi:hypothetical protein OZ813_002914 [Yersinia enterocolitica]
MEPETVIPVPVYLSGETRPVHFHLLRHRERASLRHATHCQRPFHFSIQPTFAAIQ